MRNKLAYCVVTLVLTVYFAGASAQENGAAKLAIVPSGELKPGELLALTEAKLFELKEIELLERTEIDKVFAEQKLAGLFGASDALQFGLILKADMFAVLETTSIVVFDAHTGLRFADETLPEKLDDAATMVHEAVKTAVEKRQKLTDGNLVTLGVLEVRNIDLPISRDAWCRAVAGMLERSLLHRGGAVLERSRLQFVNKERNLPGDATNELLASVKLIDLNFTRNEKENTFTMTAKIGDETLTVEGAFDQPLDAVHQLADKLLDGKAGGRNVTEAAREAEAARFAAEALFLDNFGTGLSKVMEKIEAAVALDPENLQYRDYLYFKLREQLDRRMNDPSDQTFKRDWDLRINLIDADTMRSTVQDIWRCEELAESFPSNYRFYYRATNAIRPGINILANHVHPEFKEEIRKLNRLYLDRWLKRYRTALDNVNQETFPAYLSLLSLPTPQDTADLVSPYAEVIENTLRLSHEYDWKSDSNSVNLFSILFEDFARLYRQAQSENIAGTSPDVAAQMERTLVLMEQDSQLIPQICAWIAKNRPAGGARIFESSNDYFEAVKSRDAYFDKVNAYFFQLPKEAAWYNSKILYGELLQHLGGSRTIDPAEKTLDLARFSKIAGIIELANSREEYVESIDYEYITWVANAMKTDADKTEFMKRREQFDPVLFQQFALAERLRITVNHLKQQAAEAGIEEMRLPVIAALPWKSEITLLPKAEGYEKIRDAKIIMNKNMLYSEVRKAKTRENYVVCVNLTTLEKRYIFIHSSDSPPYSTLEYVDETNIYVRGGLNVYPLDGSEPWRVTMKEGLPTVDTRVLGTLGDWCYAVGGKDYLLRVHLKTHQWELLSSSRAKEGKTPFIDGRRIEKHTSIVDSKREQILFSVYGGFPGFWAIHKDGTFEQLNVDNAFPYSILALSDEKNLLYEIVGNLHRFDLNDKTLTQIGNTFEFALHTGCAWKGYVWGSLSVGTHWRWGRKQIGTKMAFEPLPVPEAITQYPENRPEAMTQRPDYVPLLWYPSFCAPTPDGKNLVVADDYEIILLQFEEL
ncbi:MAG: hypothetical protein LBI05_02605 [Planctomycetaceae bacterium]|jgi:hypothetical protein|nr:hypothetical protein [Planctomycetaceae bacterium]